LKTKHEAFDTFKRFKALVENERGCKIKCLRTDRGGQFCSKYFQNYCDMNGIKRQLTTTYTKGGRREEKSSTKWYIFSVEEMMTPYKILC
jgi:transposase InsO family protein